MNIKVYVCMYVNVDEFKINQCYLLIIWTFSYFILPLSFIQQTCMNEWSRLKNGKIMDWQCVCVWDIEWWCHDAMQSEFILLMEKCDNYYAHQKLALIEFLMQIKMIMICCYLSDSTNSGQWECHMMIILIIQPLNSILRYNDREM